MFRQATSQASRWRGSYIPFLRRSRLNPVEHQAEKMMECMIEGPNAVSREAPSPGSDKTPRHTAGGQLHSGTRFVWKKKGNEAAPRRPDHAGDGVAER